MRLTALITLLALGAAFAFAGPHAHDANTDGPDASVCATCQVQQSPAELLGTQPAALPFTAVEAAERPVVVRVASLRLYAVAPKQGPPAAS